MDIDKNVCTVRSTEKACVLLQQHGWFVIILGSGYDGGTASSEQQAMEQGGGLGVRECTRGIPGAHAQPVGACGFVTPRAPSARCLGALPSTHGRRQPHRAWHDRVPGTTWLAVLGRRARAVAVAAVGMSAVVAWPGPRRSTCYSWKKAGEVWTWRLAQYLTLVGEDMNAAAGGEPCSEVLHPSGQCRQP
uniref:Uncharacterized protein n=1 Tax=Oryza barthii TaxID=65489 RepID=A0A0D3G876_9ORYZ